VVDAGAAKIITATASQRTDEAKEGHIGWVKQEFCRCCPIRERLRQQPNDETTAEALASVRQIDRHSYFHRGLPAYTMRFREPDQPASSIKGAKQDDV
jgi:hypothetical protein